MIVTLVFRCSLCGTHADDFLYQLIFADPVHELLLLVRSCISYFKGNRHISLSQLIDGGAACSQTPEKVIPSRAIHTLTWTASVSFSPHGSLLSISTNCVFGIQPCDFVWFSLGFSLSLI